MFILYLTDICLVIIIIIRSIIIYKMTHIFLALFDKAILS